MRYLPTLGQNFQITWEATFHVYAKWTYFCATGLHRRFHHWREKDPYSRFIQELNFRCSRSLSGTNYFLPLTAEEF